MKTKKIYADLEIGSTKSKDCEVRKVLDKYKSQMLNLVEILDKQ
jgi:hypothetical protein